MYHHYYHHDNSIITIIIMITNRSLLRGDFPTRTRLPEDRDKRYGMDPFFGMYIVPQRSTRTVLQIGDPVMVMTQ